MKKVFICIDASAARNGLMIFPTSPAVHASSSRAYDVSPVEADDGLAAAMSQVSDSTSRAHRPPSVGYTAVM